MNVGLDLSDVARWERLLRASRRPVFRRLFFPEEHGHCSVGAAPAVRYASCWSAKEAVYKAIAPLGRLSLRNIRILHDDTGRPFCQIMTPELVDCGEFVRLTITHTSTTVAACAVIVMPDRSSVLQQNAEGLIKP